MFASSFRTAWRILALMTVLTGIAYPLTMTGLAGVIFPGRAGGSLVRQNGEIRGSWLIAQSFDDPRYFSGRPGAVAQAGNGLVVSSGSNDGPAHPRLLHDVAARVDSLRALAGPDAGPLPVDLVTTSASGLDPHISPAAALWQVPRVASARGRPRGEIEAIVRRFIEPRTFGLLGEPRVNVLRLNLALDAMGTPAGQ